MLVRRPVGYPQEVQLWVVQRARLWVLADYPRPLLIAWNSIQLPDLGMASLYRGPIHSYRKIATTIPDPPPNPDTHPGQARAEFANQNPPAAWAASRRAREGLSARNMLRCQKENQRGKDHKPTPLNSSHQK